MIDAPQMWKLQAACSDVPTDVFYANVGIGLGPAREVCASCPVAAECLAYAVENREQLGMWGGAAPRERHKLKDPDSQAAFIAALRERHDAA